MKQSINALKGLRYKLRMMGIAKSGPSYIYGDNMLAMYNTSKPEFPLKIVCYNAILESVAMRESLVSHITSSESDPDLVPKFYRKKNKYSVSNILHDIHDGH